MVHVEMRTRGAAGREAFHTPPAPGGDILRPMRTILFGTAALLLFAATSRGAGDLRAAGITGNDVRVRAGPGTKHAALATLAEGDLVLVAGAEGRWVRILLPGGFACFIHSSLVRRDPGGDAVVSAEDVLLRPTPGKELLPLETHLGRGDVVTVLGEEGEWLRVIPPETVHLYVYDEFVKELGPAAEYRAKLDDAAATRRESLLSGRSVEALRAEREAEQKALRAEALAAGEQVLAGEGDLEGLRRVLERVILAADDDLTKSYANSLLLLLGLREDAERVRARLAEAESAKAEAVEDLRRRLESAQADYERALNRARELRDLRDKTYQGVGTVEARDGGFALVERGRVVYRLESSRFRLADYLGRRVTVSGKMAAEDPVTGAPRLLVDRLEILPEGSGPR